MLSIGDIVEAVGLVVFIIVVVLLHVWPYLLSYKHDEKQLMVLFLRKMKISQISFDNIESMIHGSFLDLFQIPLQHLFRVRFRAKSHYPGKILILVEKNKRVYWVFSSREIENIAERVQLFLRNRPSV